MEKTYKTFTDPCPTQKKTYTVQVEYVDATSYADTNHVYKKGNTICDYCEQGNECDHYYSSDCPITAKARSQL